MTNLLVNGKCMTQLGYAPPPLGLLYLMGIDTRSVLVDAAIGQNYQEAIRKHQPRYVGTTMYTPGRHESLEILRFAKAMGAVTIAGGPHVSLMTEQLVDNYPFVDHWVKGYGCMAWRQIVDGQPFDKVVEVPVEDLDGLPMPAWDRVNPLGYAARGWGVYRGINVGAAPRVSIIFGDGCGGKCTFCSTFWVKGPYRHHSPEWMDKELQFLWNLGVRHLVWQDDCLTVDREAFLELCKKLDKYQFVWHGTTRADCIDDELATRMAETGCYQLAFGIEHGSQKILEKMHKNTNLEAAFAARAACKKAGIIFTALMMDGFPYGDEQTGKEDAEFRNKLAPDEWGSLGHLAVLPGTHIYKECVKAGLLDDSFWLGPEPWYVYHGGL
jgi:anaerobic magnesium-protoporphyrin IX monomethyl ester cyclase